MAPASSGMFRALKLSGNLSLLEPSGQLQKLPTAQAEGKALASATHTRPLL